MDLMEKNANEPIDLVSSYHEKKIGKTLYRVTGIYKGEIELGKSLEDLTVRKILRAESLLQSEGVPNFN